MLYEQDEASQHSETKEARRSKRFLASSPLLARELKEHSLPDCEEVVRIPYDEEPAGHLPPILQQSRRGLTGTGDNHNHGRVAAKAEVREAGPAVQPVGWPVSYRVARPQAGVLRESGQRIAVGGDTAAPTRRLRVAQGASPGCTDRTCHAPLTEHGVLGVRRTRDAGGGDR